VSAILQQRTWWPSAYLHAPQAPLDFIYETGLKAGVLGVFYPPPRISPGANEARRPSGGPLNTPRSLKRLANLPRRQRASADHRTPLVDIGTTTGIKSITDLLILRFAETLHLRSEFRSDGPADSL